MHWLNICYMKCFPKVLIFFILKCSLSGQETKQIWWTSFSTITKLWMDLQAEVDLFFTRNRQIDSWLCWQCWNSQSPFMSFTELSQHNTIGEQLSMSVSLLLFSLSLLISLCLTLIQIVFDQIRVNPILPSFLSFAVLLWEGTEMFLWLNDELYVSPSWSLLFHLLLLLSLSLQAKIDTPPATAIGAKAAPIMATKAGQPPLTGIGTV